MTLQIKFGTLIEIQLIITTMTILECGYFKLRVVITIFLVG